MEELLHYILSSLVENKEAISIECNEEPNAIVLTAEVDEKDVGKIIGKNGKVAQAIRSILHSACYKEGKKVIFKIKR